VWFVQSVRPPYTTPVTPESSPFCVAEDMAKMGEGDDRWLVKDREDGANVNGWHWQEKDCLPWSKERLGSLLDGLPVVAGDGAVWLNVVKVQAVTGEAYVNIRKVEPPREIPGFGAGLLCTAVGWELVPALVTVVTSHSACVM
jgi:hypothetical protein